MLVPRRVHKIPDERDGLLESPREVLRAFRDNTAWVLLGEPGAGKSTALAAEAEATGGQYLRIDEFIHIDPEPSWQSKTLFLDGLDEVRAAGGGASILQRIRRQLKRLGSPAFRIACRAADWYGSTDSADLKVASPDGQLTKLLLDPLSREDILAILRENHGIYEPTAFIEEAEKRGVADLLDNPQTLELLAEAVRNARWPNTRDETYRLACEKLADEANKRYRDRARSEARSVQRIIDAAGQLCAVLLFSDKTGVALDRTRADERFPTLTDCVPPDAEAALQAVGSKLFRPEGEERVMPTHRSIAEYLAARWLARRIDTEKLPLRRVTSLLLGYDGGVVAGLRGIFAWLALHCQAARPRLIEADPLTAIVYGDVKPMSIADKRHILKGLRREAERFTAFRRAVPAAHPFGALAHPELREDFLTVLQSPERDNASQALADCVLDILAYGDAQPDFAPALLTIVRDDTRWLAVRKGALDFWLKVTLDSDAALALLDDVATGRITDREDELAGALLRHLYPKHLDPEALLRHLHSPKVSNLLGMYVWFWEHDLPRCAPDEQLPILLDGLVDRPEFGPHDRHERRLNRMADGLLARGVTVHGDSITDDRLLAWLGIGVDKYGQMDREKDEQKQIAGWLSARPARYKALLGLCFQRSEQHKHPALCVHIQEARLHNATAPDDIGLWHLEQASLTAIDALTQVHLREAVSALIRAQGASGLSLDRLELWGAAHPERKQWLVPLLYSEIPNWRTEAAVEKKIRKQNHAEAKRARTIGVTRHLPAIRDGTAPANLMHELAGVWMNLFAEIRGETLAERFDKYCDNANEVFAAAETGFRNCALRADLPTVSEIVTLSTKQREHLIRRPCLIGMDLRWLDGFVELGHISDETLRCMIAFRLTYGADDTPAWFLHLVRNNPALVATVLIAYASATLKAGKDFVESIYPLAHDPEYRAVATIAAPRLLEGFPVRARAGQLQHLENLLKVTLHYAPGILRRLIEKKTAIRGMDVAQRVYWYATATLFDPTSSERTLLRYVGKSGVRAHHLADFLSDRDDKLHHDYDLPAKSIGKLIELIAPHAETTWPPGGGRVTHAMQQGDLVRAFITRLGTIAKSEAAQEIDRLLRLGALTKLRLALENARHQQRLRQRESEFRFLPPRGVAQVLANEAPASNKDLVALALDHLDDIAREIRQDNDDGFRAFWNVKNRKPIGRREENLCRDALLTRLRARLLRSGVECQPEGDYANDKRADMRLSYHTEFELPIEIKRESNPALWEAPRDQLIAQYAVSSAARGHGIYLVLWFGGEGQPRATDGGKKPRSAEELQMRLTTLLEPIARQRIFVRVLDVSWPAPTRS